MASQPREYDGPTSGYEMTEHILSGRIKHDLKNGKWYWTQWHVGYSQRPCDSAVNVVTDEEANAEFDRRLIELRKAWGYKGHRFVEIDETTENSPRRIRFFSLLKNGKRGKLTGILYMTRIVRK